MPSQPTRYNETALVLLMGAVQFVNILEFMIVMPLGPTLAAAFNMPLSAIGNVVASYTMASAVSGLASLLFLDQFERKRALLMALCGLFISNVFCVFANSGEALLAARIASGLFGGPVLSLALAMVTDCVPAERRGRAIGRVLSGFAVASVFGVPMGLELANLFNWRAPFIMTAALVATVTLAGVFIFPARTNVRNTHTLAHRWQQFIVLLRTRKAQLACAYHAIGMAASFSLIPNIAAHVQINMHLPPQYMSILYAVGGVASFLSLTIVGRGIDKFGILPMITSSSLLFSLTVLLGFVLFGYLTAWPVLTVCCVLFVMFMTAASARNVCAQTLSSQIAPPQQRAGLMAITSAAGNGAAALAAKYSAWHLHSDVPNTLPHMPSLAIISALGALLVPVLMWQTLLLIKKD